MVDTNYDQTKYMLLEDVLTNIRWIYRGVGDHNFLFNFVAGE